MKKNPLRKEKENHQNCLNAIKWVKKKLWGASCVSAENVGLNGVRQKRRAVSQKSDHPKPDRTQRKKRGRGCGGGGGTVIP